MLAHVLVLVVTQAPNPLWLPDTPNACESCAGWNRPHPPVHVFGNTYWVGVEGLSVVAIDSGAGLVLLDGALPQSVPLVEASLQQLGREVKHVKLIGTSHAHYDHVGGIAKLQQLSGATVLASSSTAEALKAGCPTRDDPQAAYGCETNGFPRVTRGVRVVRDREVIKLGALSLTAHFTPGHTVGATTWTWRSCEGSRCLDFVYADSLNPVSADGFKFAPIAAAFRAATERLESLRCDVLLTPHPDASETLARLTADAGALVDGQACRAYAKRARQRLDARLASEK
ncbi:MAG: subclass B3 metallo-beta-lactamase [Archangiaceae bacterium]|nr:subclass B3 metallo-beta-lactamase [Archangiaceae bacterium]